MKKINIDIIRLIAAFMIVAIHTYPFEFISNDIDFLITRVLFRVAVPFFLMITGYFALKNDSNKLLKYTKKLAIIYGLSMLLYLPINIYNGYFHNFNIFVLLKDIFLTGTLYHLWYFPALILGIWLSYFLINKLSLKKSLIISLILYVIGIFGDSYYGLVSNLPLINTFYKIIFFFFDYTRNGIFYIPIFLIMGYSINKKELNFPINKYLYAIILVITLLFEGIITLKFNLYHHSSMYFSLIPLMYILFANIISNCESNTTIRSVGTYIYILHPFIIVILHFLKGVVPLSILNNSLVNYLLVSILSLIAALILNFIITKIKVYNSSKVSLQ